MERKLGASNDISRRIDEGPAAGDGRERYAPAVRIEVYERLLRAVLEVRPDLEVALCLEDAAVWEALGLSDRLGRCNCVL